MLLVVVVWVHRRGIGRPFNVAWSCLGKLPFPTLLLCVVEEDVSKCSPFSTGLADFEEIESN